MDSEQDACQPSAGNLEPHQHAPQQHRADRMQQHIYRVVPDHVVAPQLPLSPEGNVGQGKVRAEPNRAQPERAPHQWVPLHQHRVVPHELPAQRRPIDRERQQENGGCPQD